jgi:hypothetical protein
MATRSEIAGRVLRDLKRVGLDTTQATDVNVWINQAIREDIELEYNWPCMYAEQTDPTVAGQESYSPTNASTLLKEIVWVRFRQTSNDEWQELDELDRRAPLPTRMASRRAACPVLGAGRPDTIWSDHPRGSTYSSNFGEFLCNRHGSRRRVTRRQNYFLSTTRAWSSGRPCAVA